MSTDSHGLISICFFLRAQNKKETEEANEGKRERERENEELRERSIGLFFI